MKYPKQDPQQLCTAKHNARPADIISSTGATMATAKKTPAPTGAKEDKMKDPRQVVIEYQRINKRWPSVAEVSELSGVSVSDLFRAIPSANKPWKIRRNDLSVPHYSETDLIEVQTTPTDEAIDAVGGAECSIEEALSEIQEIQSLLVDFVRPEDSDLMEDNANGLHDASQTLLDAIEIALGTMHSAVTDLETAAEAIQPDNYTY